MLQLARRLVFSWRRSVARRGYFGTVIDTPLFVSRQLWSRLARYLPASRAAERRDATVDEELGIDSKGVIDLRSLTVTAAADGNAYDGYWYEPTMPEMFNEVLALVPGDLSRFVFIDLGSGKGRVLLLASRSPFQRIIGVEFANELHEVACQNVARFSAAWQQCRAIDCVCADAAQFELPSSPLVLFMYNPFGPVVMQKVVDNVCRSLQATPRELYLLYTNPLHSELWLKTGRFEVVAQREAEWKVLRAVVD